jgi:purine-binding chemotaxis protein CheW
MDFLEIRKKAKERAAGRGEGRPAAAEPPAPGPPPPAPAPAKDLKREPSPEADPALAPADTRFTTWRPGSGAPPVELLPAPDLAVSAAGAAPSSREQRLADPEPPAAPEPHPAPATSIGSPAPSAPCGAAPSPLEDFFYRADEEAPEVPALALGAAADEPAGERPPLEEFLTFRLGGEEYGVRIEQVREVLRSPPITEVPRAPAHVLGVVTVRGEVVAVIDPRGRLGLPPARLAEEAGRIVIVDAGPGPCGLLVDAVASVVRLPRGTIEPRPQGIGGPSADCLAGIGRERDRIFTVLDLTGLLRRSPARSGPEPGGRPHAGA